MRVSAHTSAASRRRLAILACAGLAGAALPATALMAGPAMAALSPSCIASLTTVTCTFAYNTAGYSWTVPAGVTTLSVTADGGSGQGVLGGAGGTGAGFLATVTGAAGQTLDVTTGGAGAGLTGGTNSGGSGGTPVVTHGGGGGGETVVTAGANTLLVAGGGGGGGIGNHGGNAGTSSATTPAATTGANGSSALSPFSTGGLGGKTVGATGGAAGNSATCSTAATAGASLQGGNGADCPVLGGGGGGGGFFGGGGGGGSSGGGGGSSFPSAAFTVGGVTVTPVTSTGSNTGNGEVIIAYARVVTSTTLTSSLNPSNPGQPVTFTATVSPTDGNGTVEFDYNGTPISGCATQPLTLQSGSTYTATCTTSTLPVGVDPITATYSGDTSYLTSTSGTLDQDVIIPAPTRLRAFGEVTSTGHIYVSARLTSHGSPVSGQVITFTTVLASMPVCTATTNAFGIATCEATGEAGALIALGQGAFTASFAGTVEYRPADALGIINGH